ncbi:hypothetical protein Vafri_19723, partial [Volvox africanus]
CWHRSVPSPLLHGASGHRRALATAGAVHLDDVEGDDVRDIAEGSAGLRAELFPFVVACGEWTWTPRTPTTRSPSGTAFRHSIGRTFTRDLNISVDECTNSFGMVLNQAMPSEFVGPFYERRCQRFPVLKPGMLYVVLLMGDGGRQTGVSQVHFMTSTPFPSAPISG